jgi:2-phospho-L-lactate guanylyltransferase
MSPPFALVPVKDPWRGKSRLAPLLHPAQRHELNLALARRTLQVCAGTLGAERTLVVTAADSVRAIADALGVRTVDEDPGVAGLNAALARGMAFALDCGAQALLVVPTDLPLLSAPLLGEVIDAMPAAPGCVLVPDRRARGTNLMGLAPAKAEMLAFGASSLRRHARRARQLGYAVRIHACTQLAVDMDLPEDYLDLANLGVLPSSSTPLLPKPRAAASRRGPPARAPARSP